VSTRNISRATTFAAYVVILALLTPGLACMARCGGKPCHGEVEQVPRCHKQAASESAGEPCQPSGLLPADLVTVTKPEIGNFLAADLLTGQTFLSQFDFETHVPPESTSPGCAAEPRLSVVFRI
jgi:hypothetical protein